MRFHMLQNAQMALDFLRYKKIKLVNIRAEDIVDGNPKLTLGLIWTIILHFQVCRSNRIQLLQIVAYISSLTSAWNSSSMLRALIDLTLRAVAAQPGANVWVCVRRCSLACVRAITFNCIRSRTQNPC